MSNILPNTFAFLHDLNENNNRDWFTDHKPIYQKAHANVAEFMDSLITEMKKVDQIENESGKKSMFRIYNDVRFAKGKPPYKTHFGAHLSRATCWLRGGYYIHFEPGNTFLGCGFWSPNKDDLKLIRDELAHNAKPLRSILSDPDFKKMFGELKGEAVKTAPRGFDKDHPNIDLIRFKSFYFEHHFFDSEVLDENFVFEVTKTFLHIRPFFDYMSEILTRHLE
tara:strand:+ start:858 stop:1526 length:669 start_codon:yes stop_codon:yes gene_type:complete